MRHERSPGFRRKRFDQAAAQMHERFVRLKQSIQGAKVEIIGADTLDRSIELFCLGRQRPAKRGKLRKLALLLLHERQMRLEERARETASQTSNDTLQHGFVARRRHQPYGVESPHRPTCASTSARKKRSTKNMKAIDGTNRIRAVMEAIW